MVHQMLRLLNLKTSSKKKKKKLFSIVPRKIKFKNIVQEGKKKLFSIVPRKIRDCPFSCSPFQINRAGSITFKWEIVKEMGDSERNKSRG